MKHSLAALIAGWAFLARADGLAPIVEIEEDVYTCTNANNGAGPMWCSGSTSLVRAGDHLFASGLETVPDARPLNNCRWMLFRRGSKGWERVRVDDGRTREPAPLAAFPDGRVFLSANPTLGPGPEPNGGPARPDVFQFAANDPHSPPVSLKPAWQGTPPFTEHSYRSFAADGAAGELVLFRNIGYTLTRRSRNQKFCTGNRIMHSHRLVKAGAKNCLFDFTPDVPASAGESAAKPHKHC